MNTDLPVIIQGGMGAAVSDWRLANAVSSEGQLGVVSGVALGALLARRLEVGDPGGHMRRALAAFPVRDAAERILSKSNRFGRTDESPTADPVDTWAQEI